MPDSVGPSINFVLQQNFWSFLSKPSKGSTENEFCPPINRRKADLIVPAPSHGSSIWEWKEQKANQFVKLTFLFGVVNCGNVEIFRRRQAARWKATEKKLWMKRDWSEKGFLKIELKIRWGRLKLRRKRKAQKLEYKKIEQWTSMEIECLRSCENSMNFFLCSVIPST